VKQLVDEKKLQWGNFLTAEDGLMAISRLDLSFAYPLLALAFAINPLLARPLLGESIPLERWVGILVIWIGVAIISWTGR
jgi:drug/metabolite transporter (DMT)-like permease